VEEMRSCLLRFLEKVRNNPVLLDEYKPILRKNLNEGTIKLMCALIEREDCKAHCELCNEYIKKENMEYTDGEYTCNECRSNS